MAQIKKLKLNGATIYPVTHPKAVIDPSSGRNIAAAATQSANGLMSAADKKKLDAFGAASNYVTNNTAQAISGKKTFNDGIDVKSVSGTWAETYNKAAIIYGGLNTPSSGNFESFIGIKCSGNAGALYLGTQGAAMGFYLRKDSGVPLSYFRCWNDDGRWETNKTITASAHVTASDVRLKENIQNIEASDERLQKAGEISLKSYTLKDDENGTIHYGYIAQEVEQLIPDVVLQGSPSDDNPDPIRGLNYTELLALKTAYLEKKNADLEARIQKLESLVAKLSQSETEE